MEKQVIFNQEKANNTTGYTEDFCKRCDAFVAKLKEGDYLHIDIDPDFIKTTVDTYGSDIVKGFESYLGDMVKDAHPFMKDIAQKEINKRMGELKGIIDDFVLEANRGTIKYVLLKDNNILLHASVYNKNKGKFEPDAKRIKEYCTITLEGDKLAFLRKMQGVVETINELKDQSVKLFGNDYIFGGHGASFIVDEDKNKCWIDENFFDVL